MYDYATWLPMQAVLNTGPHYVLENQNIWSAPIEEFKMPCRISSPVKAEFDIFQQKDGLLVRGDITGQVTVPCDRCAEETTLDIKEHFDSFEPFPAEETKTGDVPDPELDEYFIRFSPLNIGFEINLAALAWEEFAQALPVRPLCTPQCAGLCPKCGINLNQGQCGCAEKNSDPRLDKLRGLKISKAAQ